MSNLKQFLQSIAHVKAGIKSWHLTEATEINSLASRGCWIGQGLTKKNPECELLKFDVAFQNIFYIHKKLFFAKEGRIFFQNTKSIEKKMPIYELLCWFVAKFKASLLFQLKKLKFVQIFFFLNFSTDNSNFLWNTFDQ